MQYKAVWPEIKGEMLTHLRNWDVDDVATKYFDRCLEYTVPKRLLPRLLWPKIVYQTLSKDYSDESARLTYIIAWCNKMVSGNNSSISLTELFLCTLG